MAKIATLLSAMLRGLALCVPLALADAPTVLAASDEPTVLTAPIAAQPLAQALEAFARQTGLHLAYVSDLVQHQSSRDVPAGLGADEALARLLQGTGLRFEFLTARSVAILADEGPARQPPAAAEETRPTIIVTGSRIPVPANITATSPLVVVTAEDIVLAGHTDTGDVISALPQMITTTADDGNNVNNWGIATADLRGLGPQRTVVLVNGKRLGLGDPNTGNPFPAPDLDQIPLPMIERVDVLTGGASATYGSDAVAGVVNFILKDHVQGVQIDAQLGFAEHTQQNTYIEGAEAALGTAPPHGTAIDGARRDLSLLAGTGFADGAGQITGYFVYHHQDPVYGSNRDFSSCTAFSLNYETGVPTQGGVDCSGVITSNILAPNTANGGNYSVVGNQFVPFPAAGSVPPPYFNAAPYVSAQRQDTRYQAGLLAHIDLSQEVIPYLELSFMGDHTLWHFAPSALFIQDDRLTVDGNYFVNCSNPLLSAEEAGILCTPAQIAADKAHPGTVSADVIIGRRNIEGGPRLSSFEHTTYRAVGGVRGKLSDAWSYDAYALYYYTSLSHVNENHLNYAAVNNALQVTTDQTGRPVCISGGSCVPYDIFRSGGVTAQQLAYLTASGTDSGANSMQLVAADVTGQLGHYGLVVPWAREGVAFNVGAEHRAETLRYAPDDIELSGELAGYSSGTVAIDKGVSIDEGFAEIRIPIAQRLPLINDLTVDAGFRHAVYSTTGVATTYKVGLQFAPLADVRLRTSFDRVVRAPNLIELYTPLTYGGSETAVATVATDPCAPIGATPAAASLAQCMRSGVTAAQYGNGVSPAFGGTSRITQCVIGCGLVTGGNPALAPETAVTWSVGLTLTPTAMPTFSASVDYFHIQLNGEIGTIPQAVTLNQCLTTGDPTWCSQIVRTPAGALSGATVAGGGYVLARNVNTAAALVSGIDLQMNYRQPLAGRWGSLSASLNGSYLQHNVSTPYRSAASYDCAGLFGKNCLNGSVNPTWRHNLRVTWDMPWRLQLSVQWRFIGGTNFDNNSAQIALQNQEEGFFDPVLTHIPNYSYLDLSTTWDMTGHVQLRAGVNNALDKDPPFLPLGDVVARASSSGLNTYPTYDTLGREFFIALRATF